MIAPAQGYQVNPLTLTEVGAQTAPADTSLVYAGDVAGQTELFFDDADGVPVQFTSGQGLNGGVINFLPPTANGAGCGIRYLTELTTIAVAASTPTAIQIPANAVVLGVAVRVTTAIPGPATVFTVKGTASGTEFHVTAGGVPVAAGTTDVGTLNFGYTNGAAQTITFTFDANPGANTGRVRITILYFDVTAPTS